MKILKTKKKRPGDMANRGVPTKFALNPCSGFRETWFYRRTDDGRLCHDSSPAKKVKDRQQLYVTKHIWGLGYPDNAAKSPITKE